MKYFTCEMKANSHQESSLMGTLCSALTLFINALAILRNGEKKLACVTISASYPLSMLPILELFTEARTKVIQQIKIKPPFKMF